MTTPSTTAILKALDGLSLRAEVTAQNIANASSPGYRPLRVTFEDALARAAPRGSAAIDAVRPAIEQVRAIGGDHEVRLDLELANQSQTAARYAALIEVLNRQEKLDMTLTNGGA